MKKPVVLGILFSILVPGAVGQEIAVVTPKAAYEMAKQPSTYLVDVRSVAEYYLVGHPEMAVNLPLLFWNDLEARFVSNESFLQELQGRFKKDDVLIFMCRSGQRSRRAAEMAQAAGFQKVFNLSEGFEGEKDAKGYRTIGGWKNSLPYTYEINPELAYKKSR